MNFLHISRKFIFIFFALSCFIHSGTAFSNPDPQELGQPYISRYIPGPYQYANKYNSIVQDRYGFLYIGSDNGVLRFDGANWIHLPAQGRVSVLSDGSGVSTYNTNELFLIDRRPDGFPYFKSIASTNGLTGNIIQALKTGNDTYILTTNAFYHCSEKLEKIDLSFLPERIFYDGQWLILYSGPNGLMRLEKNKAVQWIPSYEIPLDEISAVNRSGDQWILIDGRDNATAVFELGSVRTGFGEIDQALKAGIFSCIRTLSDGSIAWGTKQGGIVISDREGQIIQSVDQGDGLYDNMVKGLFTDAADNLWVLHEQAVSRVEIPSAFSFFSSNNGLTGNIMDVIRYQGTIYAATNMGLYRLDEFPSPNPGFPGKSRFTLLPVINHECRQLIKTNNTLIAATSQGLFEIDGPEVNLLFNNAINAVYYANIYNALIVALDNDVLMFSGLNWSDRDILQGPDCPIYQVLIADDGFIWLTSNSGDIFVSEESFNLNQLPVFKRLNTESLLQSSPKHILLFTKSGEIRFATDRIYKWNPDSGEFIQDEMFNVSDIEGKYPFDEIVEDQEGRFWVSITDPSSGMSETYFIPPDKPEKSSLQQIHYRRFRQQVINCIHPENHELTWIGGSFGLVRFNPSFIRQKESSFQTHISRVTLADDSVLSFDYIRSENLIKDNKKGLIYLPHSQNRIRFHYLSTDFNSRSQPLYQYKVTGLHEEWSDWTGNSIIEFNDLPKDNYTFMVRSQDIYGRVSESDSFRFRVLPPFYASIWAMLFYGILLIAILYLFKKWRTFQNVRQSYRLEEIIVERTEALLEEKQKTDNLIANILPKTTVEELKAKGKATSSKFKMVTVLFADIQGFTKIAEQMNPDRLIDELDQFYFQFDSVVEKYNIEKIKTIGDAYMAAGGIPVKNQTNPVEVILAALEMQHHMQELKKTKADIWDLRIGIHTGSVIAGVVGQKKISYDIWGDSVNTASRMESSGEIGKVNISATTYELVKDFFDCEYRGKMPVKFKGDIDMYFVNGLKEEFATDDKHTPNEKFLTQIQLLRLLDLEEYVMTRLDQELPEDLFFHDAEHTAHVYTQVELLGRGEKVQDADLLLLRTAALLHDIGYIDHFDGHEERSVELAKEILPRYRYSEKQIDRICDLIISTKLSSKPVDLLDKIIIDANLDHLGRVDFLIQSDKLFQEYRIRKKIKSKQDWNKLQIDFLNEYEFHTDIAKKLREVPRDQQIENIRNFS
jgi:class 3 adenylate cyclase/HD superfamily phosphodiesterase